MQTHPNNTCKHPQNNNPGTTCSTVGPSVDAQSVNRPELMPNQGSPLTTKTAAEVATGIKADKAPAPVFSPSAPSIRAFWAVHEAELMHTQQLNSIGMGRDLESGDLRCNSRSARNMRKSVMNELCEVRKEHESKKLVGSLLEPSEEMD